MSHIHNAQRSTRYPLTTQVGPDLLSAEPHRDRMTVISLEMGMFESINHTTGGVGDGGVTVWTAHSCFNPSSSLRDRSLAPLSVFLSVHLLSP